MLFQWPVIDGLTELFEGPACQVPSAHLPHFLGPCQYPNVYQQCRPILWQCYFSYNFSVI